jgi:ribose transport system substrate-binding protein
MLKPLLAAAICLLLADAAALGDTSAKRIALSNSYAGNAWRQAMLESWQDTAAQATTNGIVAEATAFSTAENDVAEQAAQIRALAAEGYDAIVVDAASPDGLNDAVRQACAAGIVVVSFDGIVNEPCAYRLTVDFKGIVAAEVKYLAGKLPQGGNVLEVRGMDGTATDETIHDALEAAIKDYPQLKIVGSVHGDWSETVAKQNVAKVLRVLPRVDAVLGQGGDGYGAAQAFQAADRPMPIVVLGNRAEELKWWKEQHSTSRYETMSAAVTPGISTLAFWIAQQVLDGQKVPHDLVAPFLRIDQNDLKAALKQIDPDGVANVEYSQQDARKVIAAGQN